MKDETSLWPGITTVGDVEVVNGGLTKREYFALQILLVKTNQTKYHTEMAVNEADDLLEELNKCINRN